jgi:non-heme chloroperoxidase
VNDTAPMRFLEVAGGRIAWRERGRGTPILWVHGLPLDSRSWADQEEHFADRARNFFIDLRGYGQSSKIPAGTSDVTQLYVDDIAALLEHLRVDGVTLVGFASAGHVALRFAAQRPGVLAHLVTINGSPRFRRGHDWPWGFDDAGIAHFTDAARHGINALTDAILDPGLVFRDVDAAEAARLRAWFAPMSVTAGTDTLLGFFTGISRDDDRPLLPSIRTPTLLLTSTAGQEVPSDVGLYLRQRIPGARLVELPGADHFAFATRPALVNLLIEQVLPRP